MTTTMLPKFNMDNSETGCCPLFDPTDWDGAEIVFDERPFVRATTVNLMHIPLNMAGMIKKTHQKILDADAAPTDEYLILSTDPSPWRGEHYFAVTKDVPGADMVTLSGRYLTKVFEGPYQNAGKWAAEFEQYIASQGQTLRRLYFFYTTCPRCAKHYGKNYVIAFGEVDHK